MAGLVVPNAGSLGLFGDRPGRESIKQFAVNATETPVRHDDDYIAGVQLPGQRFDDLICAAAKLRRDTAAAKLIAHLFRIQPLSGRYFVLAKYFGQDYAICTRQRVDEFSLKDAAAQGVGARLEQRPEPAARETGTSRAKGFANGGGMMREIVHNDNTADFANNFHTPPHTFE